MKKPILMIVPVIFALVCSVYALGPGGKNSYIGTNSCKACHNMDKTGKQYAAWEKSDHAKAFKTLQTPAADKIAKEKGLSTKAAEAPECLSCHVTGMDEKSAEFDKKFSKDEGIGCEACHGAGSGYKTLHGKKENLPKAFEAGMIQTKVADGSAEKQCKTCHNPKSPTYKSFKFEEKWKLITHPRPKS